MRHGHLRVGRRELLMRNFLVALGVTCAFLYMADRAIAGTAFNAPTGASGTISFPDGGIVGPGVTGALALYSSTTTITGNSLLVSDGLGTVTGTVAYVVDPATATDDAIQMAYTPGGAAAFTGTISEADLTANRAWTMPNWSGTMAV